MISMMNLVGATFETEVDATGYRDVMNYGIKRGDKWISAWKIPDWNAYKAENADYFDAFDYYGWRRRMEENAWNRVTKNYRKKAKIDGKQTKLTMKVVENLIGMRYEDKVGSGEIVEVRTMLRENDVRWKVMYKDDEDGKQYPIRSRAGNVITK